MSDTTMRELVARLATEPDLGRALDADRAAFAAAHGLTTSEVEALAALRVPADGAGPVRLKERMSRMGGGGVASTLSALAEGVADAAATSARVDRPVAQPVAAQPVAQPISAKPVPIVAPMAAQPVAAQPVPAQPAAAQPVPAQPAAAQPVPAQPPAAQPEASQPMSAPPVAVVPPPGLPTAVPTVGLPAQPNLANDVITNPEPAGQPDLGPLADPLARLGGAYDNPPQTAHVGPPSAQVGPAADPVTSTGTVLPTAVPTGYSPTRSLLPDDGDAPLATPTVAQSPDHDRP